MKKKIFLVLVAMMAMAIAMSQSYDFSAVAPSGQILYYKIVNNEVQVVRPGEGTPYNDYVSGNLIIPASVSNNGITYPVTTLAAVGNYGTFEGCSGLTSVTIPSSIDSIEKSAFWHCNNLTGVNYTGTIAQWCEIGFEDGASNPISRTHSLIINGSNVSSLSIPNGVTSIKKFAFYNLSNLTSVTFPNSMTSIGNYAFYSCTGLTSVTFPNSMTSIGSYAFYGCNNLTEIISFSVVAPTLSGTNTFNGVPISAIVRIPCGYNSQMSYSSLWSYFPWFFEMEGNSFEAVSADTVMGLVNIIIAPNCDSPMTVFYAVASVGYIFDHWSDGNTDNPRTLTVTQDTSLVAYFVSTTSPSVEDSLFTVVANNAMGGGVYPAGSTAVIFALPQVDLQFAGWNDGGTTNPRSVIVTSDTILTALYRVPDTVRIYDTVINIAHDTTEYNHYIYDTTHVYDTLVVYDTTRVYDTLVYYNIDTLHHYYYDTTHIYDTLVVLDTTRVFDTLVYVNHYYYDTTRIFDTLIYVNIDTLHYYHYDTTHIVDTLVFYDTTSITHYVFDSTWVYDSVWVFDSLYIYVTDTVYFFDTVYIEVPVQGVDGVEMVNVKVYTNHTQIIVEGAQGMVLRLYDINGRLLATKADDSPIAYFYVQTSGTYLVRVGDYPARKVVVIR